MRELSFNEYVKMKGQRLLAREMCMNYKYFNNIVNGKYPLSDRNKQWLTYIAERDNVEINWEGGVPSEHKPVG